MDVLRGSNFSDLLGLALGQGAGRGISSAFENAMLEQALQSTDPIASVLRAPLSEGTKRLSASTLLEQAAREQQLASSLLTAQQRQQKLDQTEKLKLLELGQKERERQEQELREREQSEILSNALAQFQETGRIPTESLTALSPQNLGRILQPITAKTAAEASRQAGETRGEQLAAERRDKSVQNILEQGARANETLGIVDRWESILNSQGAPSSLDLILNNIPVFGPRLIGANTQELKTLGKELLADIKNFLNPRFTEREFFFFQDVNPNFAQSEEAQRRLLNNLRLRNEILSAKAKATDEILAQNNDVPPKDLNSQIDARIQGDVDAAVNRWRQEIFGSLLKEGLTRTPPPKGKLGAVNTKTGEFGFINEKDREKAERKGFLVGG